MFTSTVEPLELLHQLSFAKHPRELVDTGAVPSMLTFGVTMPGVLLPARSVALELLAVRPAPSTLIVSLVGQPATPDPSLPSGLAPFNVQNIGYPGQNSSSEITIVSNDPAANAKAGVGQINALAYNPRQLSFGLRLQF